MEIPHPDGRRQAAREVVKQDALPAGHSGPGPTRMTGLTRLEYERVLLAKLADRRPRQPRSPAAGRFLQPSEPRPRQRSSWSAVATARFGRSRTSCRHRGARPASTAAAACPGQIRCPYHGWAYDLTGGAARRAGHGFLPRPAQGRFRPEVGAQRNPVRPWSSSGLAGDPPPARRAVANRSRPSWGALSHRRDASRLGPTEHEDWAADWKVAMENYLEIVPCFRSAIPACSAMFTADYVGQVNSAGRPGPRASARMRERPSGEMGRAANIRSWPAGSPTICRADDRRAWRYYSMMPNIGIDVFFPTRSISSRCCRARAGASGTIRMANFAPARRAVARCACCAPPECRGCPAMRRSESWQEG